METLAARVDAALRGRYRTIRELDVEGRAHVFLARDIERGRNVALKVVPAEGDGEQTAASFLASLHAAANLEHPHILTLLDFGEQAGMAFSALPYVEGASLADLLRAGPIEEERALGIALEIGEAIEHAHARGVVHGAIRPENVLLSADHAELSFFDARGIAAGADAATDIEGLGRLLRLMLPADVSPRIARLLSRTSPKVGRRRFRTAADVVDALRALSDDRVADAPARRGLLEELKRRKVIGTALIYAGASFTVVEASDAFAASLGLPGWTPEYLARLAILGAPLALVLAWALDITATGIHWTKPRSGLPPTANARRAARMRRIGAVAVAAFVFVAGGFLSLDGARRGTQVTTRPRLDPTRIAVLEFEGGAATGELAVLARNLHERIVEGLTSVEPLSVVSLLGVRSWDNVPADSLARALAAGTLVWPRIDAVGDSILVVIRVLDGQTGLQLRSRAVVAALPQQFRLADAVGDSLADLLRQELGEAMPRRQWQRAAGSEEAYRHMLWAVQRHDEIGTFMSVNDLDAAERALEESDSLLAEAERLDPNWIEPLLRRQTVAEHGLMLAAARRDADPAAALREGIRHAERALARWPNHPEALYMRGTLRYRIWEATNSEDDRLVAEAEQDLRNSVDKHRQPPRVYERLADLLSARRRYEEALHYARLAYEEDPYRRRLRENLLRLYQLNYELRRDDEALRRCDEGMRRTSGSEQRVFHHCMLELLAWTETLPADPARAWGLMEGALDGYAPSLRDLLAPNMRGLVAGVLVRAGLPDSAVAVVDSVRRAPGQSFGTVLPTAAVLARVGRADEAVAVIQHFLAANPDERRSLLRRRELDPLWENTDLLRPLDAGDR